MKKMVVRVVMAAVLLVLAVGFRRAAAVEDQLASTQELLMTQTATVTPAAYDEVEDALAFATRIPLVGRSLLDEVREQRAQAAYWNGDYAAVTSLAAGPAPAAAAEEYQDPDLLFLAANATYRRTIQSGAERPVVLRALDDVLKRYGDVLDTDPGYTGAAYNYEFVGRLRTALARGRPSDAIANEGRPNLHGDEGNPPQGTKPPEFNVIVPMRPDERQEQFDAGVGGVTKRRG